MYDRNMYIHERVDSKLYIQIIINFISSNHIYSIKFVQTSIFNRRYLPALILNAFDIEFGISFELFESLKS